MRHSLALLAFLVVSARATPTDPEKPVPAADKSQPQVDKLQPFTGKVLPLAKALENLGVKSDADTAGVALVADDGTTYTLVKDELSRRLFLDKRLHDRQMQLIATKVPNTQMLQVTKVRTLKDGKLYDVIYWCENCQLSWTVPGPCKCCGGDTVLTEVPVKEK